MSTARQHWLPPPRPQHKRRWTPMRRWMQPVKVRKIQLSTLCLLIISFSIFSCGFHLSQSLPHLWCCSAGAKCTSLSLATSMQGSVSWSLFLWMRTSPFSTIAQAWCCNESASCNRTWNQLSKTCPVIFVTSQPKS